MWMHLINDRAVSEDHLESDAVRMHGSLLDEFDATSVRRKVTANLAAAFRAQVQRHHEAEVFGIILQRLQNATRFSV